MTYKKILEGCSEALSSNYLKGNTQLALKAQVKIKHSFLLSIFNLFKLWKYLDYPTDVYTKEQLDIAYRSGFLTCYSHIRNATVEKMWKDKNKK